MSRGLLLGWIASGIALLGVGFGGGYLLFRDGTGTKISAKESPTPETSPSPSLSPSPSPTPAPPPSPVEPPTPQDLSICTNVTGRFQFGYPPDWVTSHLKPEHACALVDLTAAMHTQDYEGPYVTISGLQTADSVDYWLKTKTSNQYGKVTRKEPAAILGRPATLLEVTIDAPAQACIGRHDACIRTIPQFSRDFGYVVDRDGRAFLLAVFVNRSELPRFGQYQAAFDKAVKTLKFF